LEFLTNALEHLHAHNFRLAVIESIIGLEIVLTRFLREYLKNAKGYNKNRIDKFLRPNFGLSSRVAGVIELCLTKNDLPGINFETVLKAIEWRNSIIHKKGKLPINLSKSAIRDGIAHVQGLAQVLALKGNNAEALPQFEEISKNIQKSHNFLRPTIQLVSNHNISVTLQILQPPKDSLKMPELEKVVKDLIPPLIRRDLRFDPKENLLIKFVDLLGNFRADFRDGKIRLINK